MATTANLVPAPRPTIVDRVSLRNIDLHLPAGPDPWHRPGKAQPCTAAVNLSYSSATAAATADDVSLSIDYGKLYRRIESEIRDVGKSPAGGVESQDIIGNQKRADILLGRDVRILGELISGCALGLLDETIAGVRRMAHAAPSSPTRRRSSQANRRMSSGSPVAHMRNGSVASATSDPLDSTFGECETLLHLPNAHLRAEGGLRYRSLTTWGYDQTYESLEDVVERERQPLVLEQEFRLEGIRCYCILGVNSHERLEKQCVIVTLAFRGSGETVWASTVVDTYQEMTRVVAEVSDLILRHFGSLLLLMSIPFIQRVEGTSYQTVEALATFIARIATMDFGNDSVTVAVEKPSAVAFVERAGVEITRTRAFFAQQDFWRRREGLEPYS